MMRLKLHLNPLFRGGPGLGIALALAFLNCAPAADQTGRPTREEVLSSTLVPYAGVSSHGVDCTTLSGKVMCGYQGWFNCEGDGAQRGWVHWVKAAGTLSTNNVKVDLWPDVSELGADEKFETAFHTADGQVAQVFSSYKKPTVLRHFQWMKDYAIDGVFVQRFSASLRSPESLRQNNTVLANCREGANLSGRTYALMYDLSGMGEGRMESVMEDWRQLRTRMKLCDDPAYLHHRGKPVVAVWGIGFNDKRKYTLADCRKLIEFLKNDPEAGGCTIMIGVPTYWREQKNDAVTDPALHEIMALADIVSPWTVGRYRNPDEATRYVEKTVKPDLAWCSEYRLDYLPVVFPGFSWHNMYGAALNSIPRQRGRFLWTQFQETKRAGASMLYVAMFDEVDEGTAIFKCTNDVPTPTNGVAFVTYEGLRSDYYLRVTGAGSKLLRGEIPVASPLPSPR
jgi:hypothetical protein